MGDWDIEGVTSTALGFGTDSIYFLRHRATGERKKVIVSSGDKDYELEQVGDKIADGDWYED